MKAMRLTLAMVPVVLLTACVSMQKRGPLPSENYDEQKIVIVNTWAEAHGAKLIWLHYPTRNPAEPSS
ncbi:MAG: hypothetical protein ABJB01_12370 [Rudaea sp.]